MADAKGKDWRTAPTRRPSTFGAARTQPDPLEPPTMSRSRVQIAGSYAPGVLMTWEGGKGICRSVPLANEAKDLTHTCKGSRRYRYYVSRALQHSFDETKPDGIRVPAREIEAAVIDRVAAAFDDPIRLLCSVSGTMHTADFNALQRRAESLTDQIRRPCHQLIRELVMSVQVMPDMMTCTLGYEAVTRLLETEPATDASDIILSVPLRLTRTGKVVRLIQADGRPSAVAPVDKSLVRMIARARGWWARLRTGEIHVAALAREEGVTRTYLGKFVQLAFLSPNIIEAILAGNQPARMSALSLTAQRVPLTWADQQQLLS